MNKILFILLCILSLSLACSKKLITKSTQDCISPEYYIINILFTDTFYHDTYPFVEIIQNENHTNRTFSNFDGLANIRVKNTGQSLTKILPQYVGLIKNDTITVFLTNCDSLYFVNYNLPYNVWKRDSVIKIEKYNGSGQIDRVDTLVKKNK